MGVILPNMIAEGFQFFSCNHIWNGPRNDTGCWILDTGCQIQFLSLLSIQYLVAYMALFLLILE